MINSLLLILTKVYRQLVVLIVFLLVTVSLTSCSTDIGHYQQSKYQNSKNNSKTPFDIKTYFDGNFVAWGMVQDYRDKVTRRFCVELSAKWQGNEGTLAEVFYFDDGEVSYRTWQLQQTANGEYSGNAEDVIGTAQGKHAGFAFHWQYQLQVPIGGSSYVFTMDDWMYQLDHHRVINKTAMYKFGIKVADISLFFDKSSPILSCLV